MKSNPRRRIGALRALGVALVALLASSASALATEPQPVRINGSWFWDGSGIFWGASEPLCPSGTTQDALLQNRGTNNGPVVRRELLVLKTFTCENGSGSFTMLLTVHLQLSPEYVDTFNWRIVGGTDTWAGIHGSGSGSGISAGYGGDDVYLGIINRGPA